MKRIWNNHFFAEKIEELVGVKVEVSIPPIQKDGPGALLTLGTSGVVGLWSGGEMTDYGNLRLTVEHIDAVSHFMFEHKIDPKWGWWVLGDERNPTIVSHAKLHIWRMRTPFNFVDIVMGKTRTLGDIQGDEMKRMVATMGWPCQYLDELYDIADAFVYEKDREAVWAKQDWDFS